MLSLRPIASESWRITLTHIYSALSHNQLIQTSGYEPGAPQNRPTRAIELSTIPLTVMLIRIFEMRLYGNTLGT